MLKQPRIVTYRQEVAKLEFRGRVGLAHHDVGWLGVGCGISVGYLGEQREIALSGLCYVMGRLV